MISRVNTDRIDEALESFDDDWSPASRRQIRSYLDRYDLGEDTEALVELIRVDIERRYGEGLAIRLPDYFTEFNSLVEHPNHVADIAYEDYRSRVMYGLPVLAARYRALPGVTGQPWFESLQATPASESRLQLSSVLFNTPRPGFAAAPPSCPDDAELTRSLRLHGFDVIKPIGSGAFSTVYLATQVDLADRFVVLKVVEQTLREPQQLAMLQHTNIVPIYSCHRIRARSVICMPYAGGVTMAEFLSGQQQANSRGGQSLVATVHQQLNSTVVDGRQPAQCREPVNREMSLPAAEEAAAVGPLERLRDLDARQLALWIFQRLAAGLAHSHARGVLHGDLKPANVLIRNDGEPAILDFNLSRSFDRKLDQRIGGTLPYMPPEVYRSLIGTPSAAIPASDIYSLGVMLFEFVTGRLPYLAPRSSADVDLDLAIEHRRSAPRWEPNDEVAPGLRSIVEKCLAFDSADRYQSADELKDDLANEFDDRSLQGAAEPIRSQAVKWVRRHPRLMSAGPVALMLVALLIPAVIAASLWHGRSQVFASQAQFERFADDSNNALEELIVDPLQKTEPSVAAAMKPLKTYGLLDASTRSEFVAPATLDAALAKHRAATIFLHAGQVAWAEVERLRSKLGQQPIAADQLQRLDLLLSIMESVAPDDQSAALAYLRAAKTKLLGDASGYAEQVGAAERLPLQNDYEVYLEAVRKYQSHQYHDAIVLLEGLADRPTTPSALRWRLLARSQLAGYDFEGAKLSLTQSIEIAPSSARLWYLRGYCYGYLRQFKKALSDYAEALRLDPLLTDARLGHAQTLVKLDKTAQAFDDLTAGLERQRNHPSLLMMRSDVLRQLGRDEESDEDFRDAIAQQGLNSKELYQRAALRLERDPEGALADLRKSRENEQNSPVVYHKLAKVLAGLGRYDEAIEELERVELLDPGNEKATIDRAVLLARLKRFDEAIAAHDQVIEAPTRAAVLYQAACVNALIGDKSRFGQAAAQLAKAIDGGYGSDTVASDPDLDALRAMPGFQAINRFVELSSLGRDQFVIVGDESKDSALIPIDASFSF